MRVCPKCGQEKSEMEFYKDTKNKDGLRSHCKDCMNASNKRYVQDNREVSRAVHRRYAEMHRERDRASKWRHKLKSKYGLTVGQHRNMYVSQNGCCAICREPTPYDQIDTDHDHTTGRVRGLLCRRCNLLVGLAENRGLHLTEAILDYIQPK